MTSFSLLGTISVNDDLDFELKSQYRLKIRAVDVVTGDWADAVVIINVQVDIRLYSSCWQTIVDALNIQQARAGLSSCWIGSMLVYN